MSVSGRLRAPARDAFWAELVRRAAASFGPGAEGAYERSPEIGVAQFASALRSLGEAVEEMKKMESSVVYM